MQAVMMVAGKSTRTYPMTLTRPKPLLPVANRPLIYHSLDQMVGLFDEVILIVGYRKEMIRELLGEEYRGIHLVYQEQKEQLGTGHAILQARPHIRGRFVACNGDDLFAHEDFAKLLPHSYAALVKPVADPSLYGVAQVDEHYHLIHMVEKPKTFLGNLANIGCYIFEPDIFDALEKVELSERGEIEIIGAIMDVVRRSTVTVVPITGFWLPTGFAWDLLKHQEFMMTGMSRSRIEGRVEAGAVLTGPVEIGPGSVVRSGSIIEGPVIIGGNCEIGPNCYLRKFTAVGDGCRIGHAVEIKNSIIMPGAHIAHLSYVGDSVIGEACNLGAGTITANKRHDDQPVRSAVKGLLVESGRHKLGAILADHVQTGIHTALYPGCKIWPSLTTLPGEVLQGDRMPEGAAWD
ncbi:MAG TPA: sugar phosphate nucleotidyltransferase [bacterium]|nr:sugar phosphate nucleotidyltransferase [bacterium]HQG44136.1 sugar phosphate nucleotidyltransferase [bacterium]HQI48712.1 sugar phosphate nucleotidyltransferase [bacterium]HQJ63693.1 sugar phosphate nucleotidyltransferase [bacterium]